MKTRIYATPAVKGLRVKTISNVGTIVKSSATLAQH